MNSETRIVPIIRKKIDDDNNFEMEILSDEIK